MKTSRFVAPVAMILALSLAAAAAAHQPFADPAQVGPYAVGHTSFVVTDPSRQTDVGDRPIPVDIWYPVDRTTIDAATPEAIYRLDPILGSETPEPVVTPEVPPFPTTTSSQWEVYGVDRAYQEPSPSSRMPFPIVMYSQGLGGPALFSAHLLARLASHGFVVAALTHVGEGALWWDAPRHWASIAVDRPRDVSFALTRILERNLTQGDPLHGLIRPDKVAASGWSYGGYAAMALAGGDDLVCDIFQTPWMSEWFGAPPEDTCVATPADPRIKAVVSLDGSSWASLWQELRRVRVPSLIMGEETDRVWDMNAYAHAAFSGFPNLRVDVLKSAHVPSFSSACTAALLLGQVGFLTPESVEAQRAGWECDAAYLIDPAVSRGLITKYMVAFLKASLAGDLRYAPYLVPDLGNRKEPDLGFVAAELPWLGIPPENRDCCYSFFAHARSSERYRADKNLLTLCCPPEAAAASETASASASLRAQTPSAGDAVCSQGPFVVRPGMTPLFPAPEAR